MREKIELIEIIVEYLKENKAKELPIICNKYKVICNEELDPFESKRLYIKSGLDKLDLTEIKQLAKSIISDGCSPSFTKKCDCYLDDDFLGITTVTRRKIIKWLIEQNNIEGELRIDEFLKMTFNLSKLPAKYGCISLEDDIMQHMINNNDITYDNLFDDILNLIYVSESQFKKFLNSLVHPTIRIGKEQEYYIENINKFLINDGFKLIVTKTLSGESIFTCESVNKGIEGEIKNLIFATIGKKPDIVLEDSLTNSIKIIENKGKSLIYTLPIGNEGLSWDKLVKWWNKGRNYDIDVEKQFFDRLCLSLDSVAEKMFMTVYYNTLNSFKNNNLPALIPQIYCHYDPKTANMRRGQVYVHQRMDFLILIGNNRRVVIEIDGSHHYAIGKEASPKLYSIMVEDDRRLKLYGYDVYRFGGYEVMGVNGQKLIKDFVIDLFKHYELVEG